MGLGKSQIYSIALVICIIFTLLCSGFPFSAFQVLCADMPRGREGRHRAGVGRISEEPVQSLWACSSAALTAKGNDNIGVTLQKQQRSWMAIRSFLLYLNKLLWPNVTMPIQVFSFKEVQVPITSSFLLTWLCLASYLPNQSDGLPLVRSYEITLWFHCSSAQESILYTTSCFYLTCILMALPVP